MSFGCGYDQCDLHYYPTTVLRLFHNCLQIRSPRSSSLVRLALPAWLSSSTSATASLLLFFFSWVFWAHELLAPFHTPCSSSRFQSGNITVSAPTNIHSGQLSAVTNITSPPPPLCPITTPTPFLSSKTSTFPPAPTTCFQHLFSFSIF